jgi:hypothetical protein
LIDGAAAVWPLAASAQRGRCRVLSNVSADASAGMAQQIKQNLLEPHGRAHVSLKALTLTAFNRSRGMICGTKIDAQSGIRND